MQKTNIKSLLFVIVLLFVIACSPKKANTDLSKTVYTDTSYHISTKEIKSNKIPDSVFNMPNLLTLNIKGMDCDYGNHDSCFMIGEIPANIKNLTALTSLSLTVNAIHSVPIEIAELKHLKSIDLTDNAGLNNIDNIEKLDSLEYLYLYGCGLTKLPVNIGNLHHLKELALTGNNIDAAEQTRIKKALPNCIIKF